MLQLCNYKTEYLVASRVQLFDYFVKLFRWSEVLKKCLNMSLDVGLLEAITVLLSLDVFLHHIFTFQTLLLPVKLEVNVASNCGDWKFRASQFHNFTLDVNILNTFKVRVLFKVLCNNFVGKLCKSLNLI